jgi:hypothetical protein
VQKYKVQLADLRIGDRIFSAARPDPQRGLVYAAGTIHDLDFRPFGPARGLIATTGRSHNRAHYPRHVFRSRPAHLITSIW